MQEFKILDTQSVKILIQVKTKVTMQVKKYLVLNYIAVDNNGLLHAMYVNTADFTDKNGAIDMLKKYNENLSQVQNILVDAGY